MDDEVFGAAAEDVDNTVENATDNALSPTEEYSENKEFDYYMEFLRALVNTTYENVDKFVKYQNDDTLKNIDIEYTIMEVRSISDMYTAKSCREPVQNNLISSMTNVVCPQSSHYRITNQ